MIKKSSLTVFLLLFFAGLLSAQKINNIESVKGDKIAVDNRNNLFVISRGTLYKFNSEGLVLSTYSNFSAGTIFSIDVSNPQKIIVYHKESSLLQILDDRLSPISKPIELISLGYPSISLAAYSWDNNIWLWDNILNSLIILDMYYKEQHKIHYNFTNFEPVQLIELSGQIMFMQNPKTGILLFDNFGTYINSISLISNELIAYNDNCCYYRDVDSKWYAYNLQTMNRTAFLLEDENIKQLAVTYKFFYLLRENGVVEIVNR